MPIAPCCSPDPVKRLPQPVQWRPVRETTFGWPKPGGEGHRHNVVRSVLKAWSSPSRGVSSPPAPCTVSPTCIGPKTLPCCLHTRSSRSPAQHIRPRPLAVPPVRESRMLGPLPPSSVSSNAPVAAATAGAGRGTQHFQGTLHAASKQGLARTMGQHPDSCRGGGRRRRRSARLQSRKRNAWSCTLAAWATQRASRCTHSAAAVPALPRVHPRYGSHARPRACQDARIHGANTPCLSGARLPSRLTTQSRHWARTCGPGVSATGGPIHARSHNPKAMTHTHAAPTHTRRPAFEPGTPHPTPPPLVRQQPLLRTRPQPPPPHPARRPRVRYPPAAAPPGVGRPSWAHHARGSARAMQCEAQREFRR